MLSTPVGDHGGIACAAGSFVLPFFLLRVRLACTMVYCRVDKKETPDVVTPGARWDHQKSKFVLRYHIKLIIVFSKNYEIPCARATWVRCASFLLFNSTVHSSTKFSSDLTLLNFHDHVHLLVPGHASAAAVHTKFS